MALLPRIRSLLARRPWIYWSFVAVLAAAGAAVVGGAMGAVDARRAEWGTTRTVWVARHALAPGDAIDAEPRSYPLAMVPRTAVMTVDAGAVARHPLAAGEVIVGSDLGAQGAVALIPAGWLAVPVANAPVVYRPGDEVSLLADGAVLSSGVVVDVDESAVMVAVPAPDAPGVGAAALAGTLVIALAA